MSDENLPLHLEVHRRVVEAQQADRDARNRAWPTHSGPSGGGYAYGSGSRTSTALFAMAGMLIGAFAKDVTGAWKLVAVVAGMLIGAGLGWLLGRVFGLCRHLLRLFFSRLFRLLRR